MSIGLGNMPNTDAPDSDYPSGRDRDNNGTGNGTPLNRLTLGDYRQFFEKMLREAGITPNGLPDNEYNGNQYFEALRKVSAPYKSYYGTFYQLSTNAPIVTVFPQNTIGNIVWTRSSAGIYLGTLSGAFTAGKTHLMCTGITGTAGGAAVLSGYAHLQIVNTNIIEMITYDTSGAKADGVILASTTPVFFEVKVFY